MAVRDVLDFGLCAADVATWLCPSPLIGFGLSIGINVVRAAIGAPERGNTSSERANGIESKLNQFVQTGQFWEAKNYLRTLDLPYEVRTVIERQIDDIERRYLVEMKRQQEINEQLNRLIDQGDTAAAIQYVKSLEISAQQRTDVIQKIPAAVQQARERQQFAKFWNKAEKQINEFMVDGNADDAARLVRRANIADHYKDAVIEKIQAVEKEIQAHIRKLHLEQQERARQFKKELAKRAQWAMELQRLTERGAFRQALKYIERLPVDEDVKENLQAMLPPETWDPSPAQFLLQKIARHMWALALALAFAIALVAILVYSIK